MNGDVLLIAALAGRKRQTMSFRTTISNMIRRLGNYFNSGQAQIDLQTVEVLAIRVAPYIDIAGKIAAGIMPAPAGAITLATIASIEAKYPQLFNGSLQTEDERKLFTLGVAGDLVKAAFPGADTSVARGAIQLAYIGGRG